MSNNYFVFRDKERAFERIPIIILADNVGDAFDKFDNLNPHIFDNLSNYILFLEVLRFGNTLISKRYRGEGS